MNIRLIHGDCIEKLKELPEKSVNCCVTSPPYFGLRDYGHEGQIGLEPTPDEFVQKLVEVFREVRRVLRDDGTLWLNIGDSYSGSGKGPAGNLGKTNNERDMTHTRLSGYVPEGLKPKDLIGIPWKVAFALQADGWYLRQDIIWHKPNPMPESVKDRCTKAHEYIFLLSKSPKYYFDNEAISEPVAQSTIGRMAQDIENQSGSERVPFKTNGNMKAVGNGETRNKRSVWTVTTKPFKGAHFATFPPDLILPCILAGCPANGVVLDPFNGAGTTGLVSAQNSRNYIGIELNAEYLEMAKKRIATQDEPCHGTIKLVTARNKTDMLWANCSDCYYWKSDCCGFHGQPECFPGNKFYVLECENNAFKKSTTPTLFDFVAEDMHENHSPANL